MNKLILICLAAAVALAVADDVRVLTKDNFDDTVNNADIVLVKFYAPWCGHCKHLAPEYAKAATVLLKNDPPVILAEVDATVESDLAQRFQVQGYPTLFIFRKGVKSEYQGPREAAGIVEYMKVQAGPAFKELATEAELDAFLKEHADKNVAVIGFGPKDGAVYKVISTVSGGNREDYRFAAVTDAALIASRGPSGKEGISMVKPFAAKDEKEQLVFSEKKMSAEEVTSWLPKAAIPLAGVYDSETSKRYGAVRMPRLTLYASGIDPAHDPAGVRYRLNRLRRVAAEFKGKLVFTLANKETDQEAGNFNFPAESKLAFAIVDAGKKFKGEVLADLELSKIKQFAQDFVDGKLEEYIKSAPIPEGEVAYEKDVRILVGKNFNSEVLNADHDTFVVAYAPWCGHCKALHPKWEEMATKLKGSRDQIMIAKIDATENDLPSQFTVRGFPTIFFVKKGSSTPQVYQGPREVTDLLNYIKGNAAGKFKDEL